MCSRDDEVDVVLECVAEIPTWGKLGPTDVFDGDAHLRIFITDWCREPGEYLPALLVVWAGVVLAGINDVGDVTPGCKVGGQVASGVDRDQSAVAVIRGDEDMIEQYRTICTLPRQRGTSESDLPTICQESGTEYRGRIRHSGGIHLHTFSCTLVALYAPNEDFFAHSQKLRKVVNTFIPERRTLTR